MAASGAAAVASPRAAAVLEVRGLRKSYGDKEVVRGVSFSVHRGQCFGLLGPNGAGKTTTLRLSLGLTDPAGGSIDLLGHDVLNDARQARQRVGVVPQLDNLDPDFSASENLLVYGRYFGLEDAAIKDRIPGLLEFAGLGGRGDMRIRELSGGMKRRLTLARALVNDPEIVFMDEPTTGLDPQARHHIWARMKTLMSQGKTILLTTHFMDEAERLCDRLAIIDKGRVLACDTPANLKRQVQKYPLYELSLAPGSSGWRDVVDATVLLAGVIGGLGGAQCRTVAAHAVHNGLTHVLASHGTLHGEKVAYGILVQLRLEEMLQGSQLAATARQQLLKFYAELGLPQTLGNLGLSQITLAELEQAAIVACAPQSDIHRLPFAVVPEQLMAAMVSTTTPNPEIRRRGEGEKAGDPYAPFMLGNEVTE